LLYFHTGALQINNGENFTSLCGPSQGAYAGLLYWQADTTATQMAQQFAGGAWYAPRSVLTLNDSESLLTATLLVVKDLTVDASATFSVSKDAASSCLTSAATATSTNTPPTATSTKTSVSATSTTPPTPSATATTETGGSGACAGIFSPGFWMNYQNHMSPQTFAGYIASTQDFQSLVSAVSNDATVQNAEKLLTPPGVNQYLRHLLAAELNAAQTPLLAYESINGAYNGTGDDGTFVSFTFTGQTIGALLHQAFLDQAQPSAQDLAVAYYLGGGGESGACLVQPPAHSTSTSTPSSTSTTTATGTAIPASSSCSAAPLGLASPFNVFILGDLSQATSDTEGGVAVGGNATFKNYSIGANVTASNPTGLPVTGGLPDVLIAAHNLTATGGGWRNGNAVYGGTAMVSGLNAGVPQPIQASSLVDFGAAGPALLNLSASYAALPQAAGEWNSTAGGYINLGAGGSTAGLYVFTVPGETLATASHIDITAPAGSTVIVNVPGTHSQLYNAGVFLHGGVDADHVLFNFPQATVLTFAGAGVQGSVLAPRATVYFYNGVMNGTLVAAAMPLPDAVAQGKETSGQENNHPFTGCVPAPPAVATATASSTTPPATTTPSATPTIETGGVGNCAGIYSPGYWKNYQNHYSDAQFLTIIHNTSDFSLLSVGQAVDILSLKGGGDADYARHLLASELNVAATPSLGLETFYQATGGATVPSSLYNVSVTQALHKLWTELYPSGLHFSGSGSTLYGATGVVNGNDAFALYVGDGTSPSGEGASPSTCDVQAGVSGVGTATATTTGGAQATATGTSVGATPTAETGGVGNCAGIYSPGYWKNYQNHYSDAQFLAIIQNTQDFNALSIGQAIDILSVQGGGNADYARHLLASELNVATTPSLGTETFFQATGGAGVPASVLGKTVNQALERVYGELYPYGVLSPGSTPPLYGATGVVNGNDTFALYVGDGTSPSGEGASASTCDVQPGPGTPTATTPAGATATSVPTATGTPAGGTGLCAGLYDADYWLTQGTSGSFASLLAQTKDFGSLSAVPLTPAQAQALLQYVTGSSAGDQALGQTALNALRSPKDTSGLTSGQQSQLKALYLRFLLAAELNVAASPGHTLGTEYFVNLPRKQLSSLNGVTVSAALTQAYLDRPQASPAGTPTWADIYAVDYIAGGGATATFDTCELGLYAPPPSVKTPELGSGELLATGLLPLVGVMLYRRRRRVNQS